MLDRRALIIGSWAKERARPSPQKIRGLTGQWAKIFESDRYQFRSITNQNDLPTALHNPTRADIATLVDEADGITRDTELLIYFVGHSVGHGPHDIKLIFGTKKNGEDLSVELSWLLDQFGQVLNISKLVVALDTCHSGRTEQIFRQIPGSFFAMFATGTAYAFEAMFSDALLSAMEQPIRKPDQRIDKRAGGITYSKIFEDARRRVITNADFARVDMQEPRCLGDYGATVIEPAPVLVPDGFNEFASDRSIYGRVFSILQLLEEEAMSFTQLRDTACRQAKFILEKNEQGDGLRFVSRDRFQEYVEFLRTVQWVVEPAGVLQLTQAGKNACSHERFNQLLLDAIETQILPDDISLEFLDDIVMQLLDDMNPPTPSRIRDRLGMKGKVLELNSASKLAIQLLPSTGRFLKGSAEAIFPSELG